MKAMVLRAFSSDLVEEERPTPVPGPGEALVQVKACGVCRTDLKIWRGQFDPRIISLPHILGHEFAGIVAEVGESVEGLAPGQAVVGYFYITCGRCRYCRDGMENVCDEMVRPGFELDGGYAEFVKMPAANLVPLDGSFSFEEAAVLPDAVAVPYHAISRMGELQPGENVLVVGVGGLGVHAVQIIKALGGRVIAADVAPERLEMARRLGADEAVSTGYDDPAGQVRRLTEGYGVDLCIDLVGTRASFDWALQATRKGGRYCIVGYAPRQPLEIDTVPYHICEWKLIGCRGSTREDLKAVVDLTSRGVLKPVIDRVYPLAEANRCLADLDRGAILGRGVLKI